MRLHALVLVGLAAWSCSAFETRPAEGNPPPESTAEVVAIGDVEWEALNPARGDQSPRAGTLWGDRNAAVPTGFLARFEDGFSSPPHIHNATYRAVVISGLIHNDDPEAAPMWTPAGSFWTQPKGEVHITAAQGANNMALVEIDEGPYLVRPPSEAFDPGERPVNLDVSNIVWVTPLGMPATAGGPKQAFLWGRLEPGESNGTFLSLPAGFEGAIHSRGDTFRAVVIRGRLQVGEAGGASLEPGSYFGSRGDALHRVAAAPGGDSVLYIRTDGAYEIVHPDGRTSAASNRSPATERAAASGE